MKCAAINCVFNADGFCIESDDVSIDSKGCCKQYFFMKEDTETEPMCSYEKCQICTCLDCHTGKVARESSKEEYLQFLQWVKEAVEVEAENTNKKEDVLEVIMTSGKRKRCPRHLRRAPRSARRKWLNS